MVSLTGWPLLILVALLTAVIPGIALIRPRWLLDRRRVVIVGAVLVAQLAGVATLGLAVNDAAGFYPSWNDLIGQKVALAVAPVGVGNLDATAMRALHKAKANHGAQIDTAFIDPATGSKVDAIIYIPRAYLTMPRSMRFPVLEVVGASFTGPSERRVIAAIDNEIAAGRLPPLVAVLTKPVTVTPDGSAGLRIHDHLAGELRTRLDRQAWGIVGIGKGAKAAVDLSRQPASPYGVAGAVVTPGSPEAKTNVDAGATQLPGFLPPLLVVADSTSSRARQNSALLRVLDWCGLELSTPLSPPAEANLSITPTDPDEA